MVEPYEALGRRLLGIRRELAARDGGEVSQRQMADRLVETWIDGVSATQTQVSRWEAGKARPRKVTLTAYARLAGVDVQRLLRLAGYGYIDDLGESLAPKPSTPPAVGRYPDRPDWRWLAPIGLLIVVLFLAWAGHRGQRATNPTRVSIEDDRLDVLAGDRRLWSFDLSKEVRPRVEPLVRDLDLDGRNEVLVSFDPVEPARQTGRLVGFSHDGARRWEFIYGRKLTLGERRFTPYFVAQHLSWIDTPAGGRVLLIARHERWFPAQVVLLDPRDGTLESEYWHPGYIEVFTVFDVHSDGHVELLLGGMNNPGDGPGRPALVALDLPFRPTKEPDAVFGLTHAAERAYLLFPRPDLYQVQTSLAAVTTLRPQDDERVLVAVSTSAGSALFYTLDSDLEVDELWVSDKFVHNHDRLLDHRYSPEERENWKAVLHYRRAPNANRERSP